MRFTIDSPLLKEGSCVQERIRQAVDEALKHGPRSSAVLEPSGSRTRRRGGISSRLCITSPTIASLTSKSTTPAGEGRTLAERQPTLTYASAQWAAKQPQPIWPSSLQRGSSLAATFLMCTGSSSHGHWTVAYSPHPTSTVP